MHPKNIHFTDLTHKSPEFDAVYDVISHDISSEYLETKEFLKNRLRVRDEGPKSEPERILIQDGYTLHLIAALQEKKVIGTIYGHLISGITAENKAICFVTYIAVRPESRKRGIGTSLVRELHRIVDLEALRIAGKSICGMVYEIEEEGKEEIKATAGKLGARPLDMAYYQPALRIGYEPEQMNLWFQPVPALPPGASSDFSIPATVVMALVRNMLTMEYVGPEIKGFDLHSKPYTAFLKSVNGRAEIGFLVR